MAKTIFEIGSKHILMIKGVCETAIMYSLVFHVDHLFVCMGQWPR